MSLLESDQPFFLHIYSILNCPYLWRLVYDYVIACSTACLSAHDATGWLLKQQSHSIDSVYVNTNACDIHASISVVSIFVASWILLPSKIQWGLKQSIIWHCHGDGRLIAAEDLTLIEWTRGSLFTQHFHFVWHHKQGTARQVRDSPPRLFKILKDIETKSTEILNVFYVISAARSLSV